MKAMILAAGRGERLRPLTDSTAKPLIKVGKHSLIEYHLNALAKAGIHDIAINVSHFPEQIQSALGDGSHYGVNIHYLVEPQALETAGGIINALPILGTEPFIVVSGDIYTDYDFSTLLTCKPTHAHLVLVDRPNYLLKGDFNLSDGLVVPRVDDSLTYANIGVYHPHFFANCPPGVLPLGPLLQAAAAKQQITGEHYAGQWWNVGTREVLEAIEAS